MASGAVRTQAKQKSVRVPVQKHHKYSPTAKRAFSLLLNLITGTIYKPIMLNNSISVSGLSFISGFHTLSCSPLPDWHWTDEMEWGLSLCLKVIPSGKIALPRAAGLCQPSVLPGLPLGHLQCLVLGNMAPTAAQFKLQLLQKTLPQTLTLQKKLSLAFSKLGAYFVNIFLHGVFQMRTF